MSDQPRAERRTRNRVVALVPNASRPSSLNDRHQQFVGTVQLVLAGSDSQGLRSETTETPEQSFVHWKDEASNAATPTPGVLLDRLTCASSRDHEDG